MAQQTRDRQDAKSCLRPVLCASDGQRTSLGMRRSPSHGMCSRIQIGTQTRTWGGATPLSSSKSFRDVLSIFDLQTACVVYKVVAQISVCKSDSIFYPVSVSIFNLKFYCFKKTEKHGIWDRCTTTSGKHFYCWHVWANSSIIGTRSQGSRNVSTTRPRSPWGRPAYTVQASRSSRKISNFPIS